MSAYINHTIFPIGDSALVLDFGNEVNEELNGHVLSLFHDLQQFPMYGMVEAVPAYSSLAIYYDVIKLRRHVPASQTVYEWICEQLEQRLSGSEAKPALPGRLVKIPVCYDTPFAPDFSAVLEKKILDADELIQLHTSKTYRVYMLGFLPGFPYMGELDEKLIMPRKQQPSGITAGSVGIAGRQTGIYPMASPGGWQIIGQTPLHLFNADQHEPAMLRAGDLVQFYSISSNEFKNY